MTSRISSIGSFATLWILSWTALSPSVGAQASQETGRIGTFDSRAVALAFWRSPEGMEILTGLSREIREAREAGDEARVKELEAKAPGIQIRMHQQVFSTGTVTDVIRRVQDRIPGIAEGAGVSLVVPKWQVIYQDPSVETLDVTMEIVALFSPTEETLASIQRMLETEPIPIDELPMDPRG